MRLTCAHLRDLDDLVRCGNCGNVVRRADAHAVLDVVSTEPVLLGLTPRCLPCWRNEGELPGFAIFEPVPP